MAIPISQLAIMFSSGDSPHSPSLCQPLLRSSSCPSWPVQAWDWIHHFSTDTVHMNPVFLKGIRDSGETNKISASTQISSFNRDWTKLSSLRGSSRHNSRKIYLCQGKEGHQSRPAPLEELPGTKTNCPTIVIGPSVSFKTVVYMIR